MTEPDGHFNPFPGLRSFDQDQDFLFFGRERNIDELLKLLRSNRFLAVLGSSGSGKSSLIRAGLVPALFGGSMARAGSSWRIAVMRPEDDPLGNLAAALSTPEMLGNSEQPPEITRGFIETTLKSSDLGLVDSVVQARLDGGDNVLLVVDQFEEIFRFKQGASRTAGRDAALAFVKLLLTATLQVDVPIYVVITMRSDFIGYCMELPGLPEAINRALYLIPRMSREELREAITGPVAVGGGQMAPRLLLMLLNDVCDDPDQLPVLQHALMRTWDYWEQRRDDASAPMDLAHYDAVGGMTEALSRHVEEAYAELETAKEQTIAELAFKALTAVGPNGQGVRRPVSVGEICRLSASDLNETVGVIERFNRARRSFLILPANVELGAESIIDIAHESLMRVWKRLRDWVEEEAKAAQSYRRLSQAAALHAEGTGSLWGNPELQLALRWRDQNRPTAAWARRYDSHYQRAMEFLAQSERAHQRRLQEAERTRRRQLRTAWLVSVVLGVATLFTLLFGAYAMQQRDVANREGTIARERAELLRANSILNAVNLHPDPLARALLLAELRDLEDEPEGGLRIARKVLDQPIPRVVLQSNDKPLRAAGFSPDGAQVVIASADGTARVWRVDGAGQAVELGGHGAALTSAAFSPDGSRVVTASENGTVRIWPSDGSGEPRVLEARNVIAAALGPNDTLALSFLDGRVQLRAADGSSVLRELDGHDWLVHSVDFNADGSLLVTASEDGTARIWDLAGDAQPVVLKGHGGPVNGARFSADGQSVVTASDDGSVRTWSVSGTEQPKEIFASDGEVLSVALSPDSRWVLSASADGFGYLRPVDGQGAPRVLRGHLGAVRSVAFAPGGEHLLTASDDGSVRVWSVAANAEPLTIGHHSEQVFGVSFSLDGQQVLTASYDRSAAIWPVSGGVQPVFLRGHQKQVIDAIYSPDESRIVTVSSDHNARLWHQGGRSQPQILSGHENAIWHAAFSPDGSRLATASIDGTARIWRTDDNSQSDGTHEPIVLSAHKGPVRTVAFSPDGMHLVTGSYDTTARIWAVDTGRELRRYSHDGEVTGATFSPDGTQVLTSARDGKARVWALEGKQPRRVLDRGGEVDSALFDPHGGKVLTVSEGHIVRVWTVDEDEDLDPVEFEGHQGPVRTAIFSPDGERVAVASDDGNIRIWNADGSSGQPVVLCRHPESECIPGAAAEAPMSLAFSPDGRRLVAGYRDGHIQVWRITWSGLVSYLDDLTSACLSADQRKKYLGEHSLSAETRYQRCERRQGR